MNFLAALGSNAQTLVSSPLFNRVSTGVILFSALLLGVETNQEIVRQYSGFLKTLDRGVLAFFLFEIVAKILAQGRRPWKYFADPWNAVDFAIVAACLVPTGSSAVAVFRLVRVLRILRLITAFPKLQIIVAALFRSVPSMGCVVALLSIHFYMFGVLGTFIFGGNDPVHFGSLSTTFLTLFQVLTLEGWADLMRIQSYGCSAFGYETFATLCQKSQAQPIASALYFISFIVVGTMIILNLLIGVVVSGMAESHKETNETTAPTTQQTADLAREIRSLREEVHKLRSELS